MLISFVANHRKVLSESGPQVTASKTLHKAATLTINDQVKPFYDKARIPTKTRENMVGEVLKYHSKIKDLKLIKEHKRKNHPKVKAFKENLPKTMVFWPQNVEQQIMSRTRFKTP